MVEISLPCGSSLFVLVGENFWDDVSNVEDGIKKAIKEELQIMCVLYTEDVGGVLELVFDDRYKNMILFRDYLINKELFMSIFDFFQRKKEQRQNTKNLKERKYNGYK